MPQPAQPAFVPPAAPQPPAPAPRPGRYEDVSGITGALAAWTGGAMVPVEWLEPIVFQDADTLLAKPGVNPKRAKVAALLKAARAAGENVRVEDVRAALL